MNERKRELAAVALLFGVLIAADGRAEPPPGPPKGEGAPGHAPGKAMEAKAAGKPDKADHGKGKPEGVGSSKDKPDEPAAPGKPDDPNAKGTEMAGAHASGRGHSELRALRDELKAGKLKKEDVAARLTKLRETNKDRQDNHRAALKARWGEQLAKPDAQQELSLHERRMAKLNRFLLLAQTEKKGKDADKLSERIEKLIELETARHEKRMAQISGAAGATPAPSAAAVNTEVAK
jgi:hypothetical protein